MPKKTYTLKFTQSEFTTFLKMILLAEHMACDIHNNPEKDMPEYHSFYQKVMKLAYEFGFHDQVEYSEEFDQYFPTREFDDEGEVSQIKEEYDDECFWQDLIYKYFGKTYQEKYGDADGKIMLEMSLRDQDLFDLVWKEIMNNGLKNFKNKKIDKKAKKLPYQKPYKEKN